MSHVPLSHQAKAVFAVLCLSVACGTPGTASVTKLQSTSIDRSPMTVVQSNSDARSVSSPSLIVAPKFIWPYDGKITSYFGFGHPLGIDIATDPAQRSPIRASAGGVVEFAGGDACCNYGYYVLLNHPGGAQTLYGHLSEIAVREGQAVAQGEVIGLSGLTGKTDGPHLHFEIRQDGNYVDPLRFLPTERAPFEAQRRDACVATPSVLAPDSHSLLTFGADFLAGYSLSAARLVPDPDKAQLDTHDERPDGPLTITFEEPAPSAARGEVISRTLMLQFRNESGTTDVVCQFIIPTNITLPNAPAKSEQLKAPAIKPTATVVRNRPVTRSSAVPTATAVPGTPRTLNKASTPIPTTGPANAAPHPSRKHFGAD